MWLFLEMIRYFFFLSRTEPKRMRAALPELFTVSMRGSFVAGDLLPEKRDPVFRNDGV